MADAFKGADRGSSWKGVVRTRESVGERGDEDGREDEESGEVEDDEAERQDAEELGVQEAGQRQPGAAAAAQQAAALGVVAAVCRGKRWQSDMGKGYHRLDLMNSNI